MIRALLITLLLATSPGEPEYIYGYGETPRKAIEDISRHYVLVSTHSSLSTSEGYEEYTGITSSIVVPWSGVDFRRLDDGTYEAWIDKSLIKVVEGDWTVQNISITNQQEHQSYRSGRDVVTGSTRVTSRNRRIVDPAGRAVSRTRGKTTIVTTEKRWDGKTGIKTIKTKEY